jgi:hypothetical protein
MELVPVSINPGVVYILRNASFRGTVVKIGRTRREPEERATELSSFTGVPEPFEVLYEEHVADCELAERLIHRELSAHRVHPKREFFDVPLKLAVGAVFRSCLRVNQHLLRENSRIAIVLKYGMGPPGNFIDLVRSATRGTTAIRLILRSPTAHGELDLDPEGMVACTPEFLALLRKQSEFEEVALYAPAET